MAYSSIDDILKEMSQSELARLTGDPQGQVIDEERVNSAIFYADTLIDASLIARYDVPFEAEIDPIITKLSLDLAIANLYEFAFSKSSIPLTVYKRKQNAMDLLKELQRGNINLLTANPGTNTPPIILSNKSNSARIFDDDTMDLFNYF
jgi:phage gp36-like protein